jgi:hypothetical protein
MTQATIDSRQLEEFEAQVIEAIEAYEGTALSIDRVYQPPLIMPLELYIPGYFPPVPTPLRDFFEEESEDTREVVEQVAKEVDRDTITQALAVEQGVVTAVTAVRKPSTRHTLLRYLCPALTTASNDIKDITKIVLAVLLPLAISGKIDLPVDPTVFAGMSLLITRAGIASLCDEYDKKDKKEQNKEG